MDKSKTGKNMKARLLQMSLGHLYAVLDAKTIRNVFKWRILQKHRDREPNDNDYYYDDIWFWCIAWHHCCSPCSTLNLIKKDTRNAIHTKVAYFSLSLSSRAKNLSLCWWVVAMVHIFMLHWQTTTKIVRFAAFLSLCRFAFLCFRLFSFLLRLTIFWSKWIWMWNHRRAYERR